ncbi:amino acid ABC transporter substrate-binding protein [Sphingopyxis sp. L1A2A]|uniref:amino acid ABC transporter substrate-binding protein n=1 Tax=Sphingopyxis sp. L1A2A TaxID=2502247 RepID=UPI0010F8C359|nr:amino acid ABC transporter substrate-binding protein [Sphingopyxis sp. L1A2A]
MTRTGEMRIVVLPTTPDAAPALAVLGSYAKRHDARLTRTSGHGEHALHWLEEGKVDAVVGHFAKTSPWQAEVALSKPVGRREPHDATQPVLRIARRNGENALILATDRAIAEMTK